MANGLDKNRVPSTGSFTLTSGATTTTVYNLACGKQSKIMYQPTSATAWTAYLSGSMSYSPDVRLFTVSHPAAAGTETFDYIVIAGDLA